MSQITILAPFNLPNLNPIIEIFIIEGEDKTLIETGNMSNQGDNVYSYLWDGYNSRNDYFFDCSANSIHYFTNTDNIKFLGGGGFEPPPPKSKVNDELKTEMYLNSINNEIHGDNKIIDAEIVYAELECQ